MQAQLASVSGSGILGESAVHLAERIRRGELRARDVVEAHIRAIEQVNPRLCALVADRFEAARREADEADARLACDGPASVGPLHGVPCTVKESLAVEGMPHSAGLVARATVRAARDATAVARIRRAGAIVLGVSNTSELTLWIEASNRLYGRTGNAYDPRRTAGGSSGGEGALVGAGAVPFGLGSDFGGSVRMPAFFNGVFGHKPTGGLVPHMGHHPPVDHGADRFLTVGPLARSAEDLVAILPLLAGPDGEDRTCRDLALGDPGAVSVPRLRVLDVADDGGRTPVCPELREAQRRCLRRAGSTRACST